MVSVDADSLVQVLALALQAEGLDICYEAALSLAAARELARSGRIRADATVLLNLTGAERPPSDCSPHYIVELEGQEWTVKAQSGTQHADRLGAVAGVLRESLRFGGDIKLGADTILLEGGLALDSVAVLELLLAVESRFGIQIEEHEVTDENLRTVGSLARLIDCKLGASSATDA
jgi:acyl carrier protein